MRNLSAIKFNMLKSHLNIQGTDDVEEEETQIVVAEEEEPPEPREPLSPPPPSRDLHRSEISVRLSLLGKTADGDGYTYLKATLTDMALTNIISIAYFKHLQFVDLSRNKLTLDELQAVTKLPYLVLLQADKNKLFSAGLRRMKYFQVLILNNNEIASVHDIYQPELSTLELGFNQIETIKFDNRMPTMKCLDFRNNMIKNIESLDFPNLDSLYLANNKITSLMGLGRLVNLRILHVRKNPIRLLDGFHEDLIKLTYINLRATKVSTLRQIKKLRVLKGLETLIVKGTPYAGGTGDEEEAADAEEDPETRVEILAALSRLKRINKAVVTPEERDEAKTMMLQWLDEGDKDDEEEVMEEEGVDEQQIE